MSTSIYMAKDKSERWKKMFAILKQCEEVGVNAPIDVVRYFNYREVEELELDDFGDQSDCIADGVKVNVDGMSDVDRYAVDIEVMVSRGWKYIIFENSW